MSGACVMLWLLVAVTILYYVCNKHHTHHISRRIIFEYVYKQPDRHLHRATALAHSNRLCAASDLLLCTLSLSLRVHGVVEMLCIFRWGAHASIGSWCLFLSLRRPQNREMITMDDVMMLSILGGEEASRAIISHT